MRKGLCTASGRLVAVELSECCAAALQGLYFTAFARPTATGVGGSLAVNGFANSQHQLARPLSSNAPAVEPTAGGAATAAAIPAGSSSDGGSAAQGWFTPTGYQLPQECLKHSDLYVSIFDNLRPWFGRGIKKEDMDACAPVQPGDSSANP